MKLTDEQLKALATIIKDETNSGANTATRIGTMLENIIDSKSIYRESIDGETEILFNVPFEIGIDFEIVPMSCMSDGNPVSFNISDITRFGFTVTSADAAIFIYQTIIF